MFAEKESEDLKQKSKAYFPRGDFVRAARSKNNSPAPGTVPTFLSVRANKVAKWKTGLTEVYQTNISCCVLRLRFLNITKFECLINFLLVFKLRIHEQYFTGDCDAILKC